MYKDYIEAKIPVFFFKEGNKVIAYSPVFDLSSCGDTEEKARSRFAEAVAIFLKEFEISRMQIPT